MHFLQEQDEPIFAVNQIPHRERMIDADESIGDGTVKTPAVSE